MGNCKQHIYTLPFALEPYLVVGVPNNVVPLPGFFFLFQHFFSEQGAIGPKELQKTRQHISEKLCLLLRLHIQSPNSRSGKIKT